MSSREKNSGSHTDSSEDRIVPLPVALRLDISLRTGAGEIISATRITWIPPRSGPGRGGGMEILLLPN